jgi:adenine-specific DNA methylase
MPQVISSNLQISQNDIPSLSFRPIHYLGSKLRILDFIENVIDDLDPMHSTVCDLFSGSGSVSFRLASKRNVVSVDIQEYSRVLCSALLRDFSPDTKIEDFIYECTHSKHTKMLEWCFEPIIEYEVDCIRDAMMGKVMPLCDLIENGSIVLKEMGVSKAGSKSLNKAMTKTISRLKDKKLSNSNKTLIGRYYGGIYFSYKQAIEIDVVLEQVNKTVKERDLLLAALLSTTSNIVNTVGKQFAQPIRPRNTEGKIKSSLGQSVNKDRGLSVFIEMEKWCKKYFELKPFTTKNKVLKLDYKKALDVLPKKTKVIYADPPYTRDHYSRYYHILETICLRDNPDLSSMVVNGRAQISRGLYREDRHQSPFCIKRQAPLAFEILVSKARTLGASLVLSYSPYDETKNSHPRLLTMSQLKSITKKSYKHVDVISPGVFTHSKLNNSEKHLEASENAEVLIVSRI